MSQSPVRGYSSIVGVKDNSKTLL